MLTGGCLCGAVRYEARGEPFAGGVCHCVTCRRASGAPMVAWFSQKLADFTLTGLLTTYRSSEHATRRFCPACGSQVLFDDDRYPDEIDVSISTLDDPNAVAPEFHIWVRSKLAWIKPADGLPQYLESSRGAQPAC
jgi:hypothetical protein